jgi:DNA modification methylase
MKYPYDYVNKIICGDCLDVMRDIPDNSIDLVIADPPYGAGKKFRNDEYAKLSSFVDMHNKDISRVSKDGFLVFCDFRALRLWLNAFSVYKLNNILLWHKELGGSGKRWFPRKTEYILWYVKHEDYYFCPPKTVATSNKMKGKQKKMTDLLLIPSINNMAKERCGHPTQKPTSLMELLISSLSKFDSLILDPFCGSGSTLVACKKLGRNFIGIDISQEYVDIANARLSEL